MLMGAGWREKFINIMFPLNNNPLLRARDLMKVYVFASFIKIWWNFQWNLSVFFLRLILLFGWEFFMLKIQKLFTDTNISILFYFLTSYKHFSSHKNTFRRNFLMINLLLTCYEKFCRQMRLTSDNFCIFKKELFRFHQDRWCEWFAQRQCMDRSLKMDDDLRNIPFLRQKHHVECELRHHD